MDIKPNAAGSFEDENTQQEMFIAINTIDQTVFVERLPNTLALSRGTGGILRYGADNLYPDKIKSMYQRSQSTNTAINTLARFTAGLGFGDEINKLIVNRDNQTLFDILDHSTDERAAFDGLALHFNYNQFGEIIEIQAIPFQTLRWKSDFSKIIFCPDWSRSGKFKNNDKIEFYPYNPENVKEEINSFEGGIDEYPGQVLYWIKKRKDIYPLCRFDPALDDTQFEHESGVYKLRNVQNGYSAGYVMFYPSALEDELEKLGLINDTKQSRGANNAGKTKHIPLNAAFMEAMKGRKMIEEIPRTGIDKFFVKQNEETKFNIYSVFSQPPILNGISKDGMFNQESFIDAFDYYNSTTEKDRQEVERVFNTFMPNTIWGLSGLQIKPLQYITERDKEPKPIEDGEENNT